MKLTLENVYKAFGQTPVVKGVNLTIQQGEIFFLLGPSGCGKTTILRMVAGFDNPDSGEILFNDRKVNDVPAHKRNTAMVFQSYALFPHMSVFDNVAYGLRLRKIKPALIRQKVGIALEMVRMNHLPERMPNQLSGGQQQRVALARSVVIDPDILLLDEPLSNLDALLRVELRGEIRRILRETAKTALYVTHDQEEAISLADRIGVMEGGVLLQVDHPRVIYRSPKHKFVAEFMGEINWLEGVILDEPVGGVAHVETAEGIFEANTAAHCPAQRQVWLGIRPENLSLTRKAANCLHAEVIDSNFLGGYEEIRVRLKSGATWKMKSPEIANAPKPGAFVPLYAMGEDTILVERKP